MKLLTNTGILIVLAVFITFMWSCKVDEPQIDTLPVNGDVIDYQGNPIAEALITINIKVDNDKESAIITEKGESDKEGKFSIEVPQSTRYVVNVRKKGFGFVSVLLQDSIKFDTIPSSTYYLQKATVVEIDPSVGGTVTVTNTQSLGTSASRADWSQSATGNLPLVLDASGRIASFIMPESLQNAWELHASNSVQLPAASLNIRPNTLTNSSGSQPGNNISVSISSVDMFAPNGMPGNNLAITSNGESGTMQSFGAVVIEVYDDEQSYNLDNKNKATAELVIPVPEWQLEMEPDLPRSVPILYYDEETGLWNEESSATYIDSLKSYRGTLSHFSVVNFDIIKTDPSACASFFFDTDPGFSAPFWAEVTTQDFADNQLYVRSRVVGNSSNPLCTTNPNNGFSLNRLPPNSFTAVAFYEDPASPIAKALYVLKTRDPGYPEITSLTHPTCLEIQNDTFCDKKEITSDPFIDQNNFPAISPILIAICAEGSNYKISVASNDPTFDFRAYNLRVSNNIPGSADCGAGTAQIDVSMDPNDPLNPVGYSLSIIIDQGSPGINSVFNVSVLEMLVTDFCLLPENNQFRVEIIDKANNLVVSALIIVPGTCFI